MGILRDYQRVALALIAISVVALYTAAITFPAERQQKAAAEWIALPNAAPKAAAPVVDATPLLASTPDFDAVDATNRSGAITVAQLHDKFSAVSFDLDAVRRGNQSVPRLFADALPYGLDKLAEVGELKQTFFQMMLPLALKVNEEILTDRNQLVLMHKQIAAGYALSDEQQAWLAELATRYEASPSDVAELLRRVDAISPALALAQSAEESGWGRSRFALNGNALFGQKSWGRGLGIVPQRRDEGSQHEVRVFPSLLDSVRSYARNLNGHPAYDDFRARRAEMRARDAELDPYGLIETLTAYSERREQYVQTIQKILRVDNLEELEGTQLEDRPLKTTQVLTRVSQR